MYPKCALKIARYLSQYSGKIVFITFSFFLYQKHVAKTNDKTSELYMQFTVMKIHIE